MMEKVFCMSLFHSESDGKGEKYAYFSSILLARLPFRHTTNHTQSLFVECGIHRAYNLRSAYLSVFLDNELCNYTPLYTFFHCLFRILYGVHQKAHQTVLASRELGHILYNVEYPFFRLVL